MDREEIRRRTKEQQKPTVQAIRALFELFEGEGFAREEALQLTMKVIELEKQD